MLWNHYYSKPRVHILSAALSLRGLVLLDGHSPINNAIDMSQTIHFFGLATCMRACLVQQQQQHMFLHASTEALYPPGCQ